MRDGGWLVSLGVASVAVLAATGPAAAGADTAASVPKSPAQKISFYRARIGGPGTYPAYARLGLANLERYRETGTIAYWDEAIRCFRQSIDYQRNFEALLGLAAGLSERHYFAESLPPAEEALKAMPSDLEAAGTLFDIQLALGRIVDAETVLNKMMEARRGFHALSRLAALREYRGELSSALEAMIEARDDAGRGLPASVVAWAEVRVGALHVANCDAAKAREAYERALKLLPQSAFAREHLAEWHAAQGQWRAAGDLFSQLLRARSDPQHHLGLAECLEAQQRPRDAAQEKNRAVDAMAAAERDGARDHLRLLALVRLEDDAHAAEGLRLAQKDWDNRQDALSADTLAWALFRNGRSTEAAKMAGNALKSGNRNPGLLLRAGIIMCRTGQATVGRPLIEQALACPLSFGPVERKLAPEARNALAVRH